MAYSIALYFVSADRVTLSLVHAPRNPEELEKMQRVFQDASEDSDTFVWEVSDPKLIREVKKLSAPHSILQTLSPRRRNLIILPTFLRSLIKVHHPELDVETGDRLFLPTLVAEQADRFHQ